MAVIEIKAATLPGFPYYFPYRTGVRLSNASTSNASKVYFGDTSVILTAEATVTSLRSTYADVDLTITNTPAPDSLRDVRVDADQAIVAASVLEFLRDTFIDTDQTITAVTEAVAFRNQQLSALLELTAGLDALAQINAAGITLDPVIEAAPVAAVQLGAAGSANLSLVTTTSIDQRFDALMQGITTAIQTTFATEGDSYQTLEDPGTTITTGLEAAALNFMEIFAGTVEVTAGITAEVSLSRVIDTELAVTVAPTATVTNADVRQEITAQLTAEAMLTQYPEANLAVSFTALVDSLDTRYGDAAVTATATGSADLTQSAVSDSDTAATATATADSLRTAYASTVQSVTATTDGSVIQDQPLAAILGARIDSDTAVQADFVDDAALAVSATPAAEIVRTTYATSQSDFTAGINVTALRTVYSDTALDLSADTSGLLNLLGPLNPLPLTITAAVDAFQKADWVAQGNLSVLGSSFPVNNAGYLVAAILEATADSFSRAVMTARVSASLNVSAIIPLLDIHRTVYVAAQELEIQALLSECLMYFIWNVQAQVNIAVANPATMLYRHAGGNPMWLMFFYAGGRD